MDSIRLDTDLLRGFGVLGNISAIDEGIFRAERFEEVSPLRLTLRTHIFEALGPKTILYKAFGLF